MLVLFFKFVIKKKIMHSNFHWVLNIESKNFIKKIKQYKLFYISTNKYFFNQNVKLNTKQSSVIIVDKFSLQNQKSDDDYNFIISFQKTIIIISHEFLKTLENLFSCNSDLSLCFLSDTKTIFDQNIDLKYSPPQNPQRPIKRGSGVRFFFLLTQLKINKKKWLIMYKYYQAFILI